MEKEYQKISNVFKFDEKFRTVLGFNEPYESLKNLTWVGTEKVDGTNVRVYWDGHEITLAGRTNAAQFQGELDKYLCGLFKTQEMEYVFEQMFGDKKVYIFGEGYGPKIQTNGDLYTNEPSFIIFDINIDGYDLKREAVDDIANKLGIKSVPVVFTGTLDEAKNYVAEHHVSTLSKLHEMEGLVLVPSVQLYDAKHNLIKCKCKYRDMVKAGLVSNN